MDKSLIKDALTPIQYVNAQGEIKTLDPQKILTFDNDNMPMGSTANTYFLVARLAERKRLETKDLESQLDALRGTLYIKYVSDQNLIDLNKGRKPPESMLTTAIESDAQYITLHKQVNESEYYARTLNWLAKALDKKMDLMQTASANLRQQYKMSNNQLG